MSLTSNIIHTSWKITMSLIRNYMYFFFSPRHVFLTWKQTNFGLVWHCYDFKNTKQLLLIIVCLSLLVFNAPGESNIFSFVQSVLDGRQIFHKLIQWDPQLFQWFIRNKSRLTVKKADPNSSLEWNKISYIKSKSITGEVFATKMFQTEKSETSGKSDYLCFPWSQAGWKWSCYHSLRGRCWPRG